MKPTLFAALFALSTVAGLAGPIRTTPGLGAVVFYEGSGGPAVQFSYAPGSSQLTTQVAGVPGVGNSDFTGLPNEFYDVYYSNADGTFNLDGEYISVVAHYDSNSSSALNIDAVKLDFGGPVTYASVVTCFLTGPNGYVPGSEQNALGAPNGAFTAMGRNSELDSMRITLGFDTNQPLAAPEPSTFALAALGAAALTLRLRKRA
jgi:hypothetical protein